MEKWGNECERVDRRSRGAPVQSSEKMLLIRSISVLIVLWRLNTVKYYQMPDISGDYYKTRVILLKSRPILHVLPSFVSEYTAPSFFICSS
ncbi:hypothetical protein Y032_0045g1184 [Ancylostoma ceylanicum]|uniref:Uncharacterized protein n=1 Tax=Ancylostoma ceylanicum TaxID=53326 RepID=A0A016UDH5_9BILA|nr:hypothetical protein Y032_0045g1184 [Ancylostoma ceylanicum]